MSKKYVYLLIMALAVIFFFGLLFTGCYSPETAGDASGSQTGLIVKVQAEGIEFLENYTLEDGTYYEIYQCEDAEKAKEFLLANPVDKPISYIIVETPTGNWGMDIEGLYKEYISDWQTDIESAKIEGTAVGLPDEYSLKGAFNGWCDNFIMQVRCGNCAFEWLEGLRYQDWTVVKCPSCLELNKINSENYMAEVKE